MNHDPVLDGVGERLRSLRQQRQLSLARLSAMTGISTSTLSRLESGGRKPTLELLLALARAYEVPLDDLVGAPPAGDPRIRLRPFQYNGRTLIPLTQRPGGPRAYKMIVQPATAGDRDIEQKTHEGYEWMYVLSGRLRLRLGEHDFVMEAGEVAEFDTRVPHWFGSAGPEPAEVLTLFGPQGERMHVRARPKAAGLPSAEERPQFGDEARGVLEHEAVAGAGGEDEAGARDELGQHVVVGDRVEGVLGSVGHQGWRLDLPGVAA
jgi:transcriptional regulator with XRE-family HTH domain